MRGMQRLQEGPVPPGLLHFVGWCHQRSRGGSWGRAGHVDLAVSLQDLLLSRLVAQEWSSMCRPTCTGSGALSTLPILMVYMARMVFHPSLQQSPWGWMFSRFFKGLKPEGPLWGR